MRIVKAIFHYLCVSVSCVLFGVLLIAAERKLFLLVYKLDILSPKTYRVFKQFWESGGVLGSMEILLITLLFLTLPICLYVFYKLNKVHYMKILTVPLNWLVNRGVKDYKSMPSVNIKNLKVEEKKTLEQIIEERLEQERKKQNIQAGDEDFRSAIVNKIEERMEDM